MRNPPTLRVQPFHVAVTGHRRLAGDATAAYVARAFQTILRQLRKEHSSEIIALSGLAEGADTIFAEQALEQHIPLEAIIAAEDLQETFAPGPARARFLYLCARSQHIHTLPFGCADPLAYTALGRALVDRSDLVIAAWDGRPAPDLGGTGGVVAYARERGRPLIHVHTLHRTVTYDSSIRVGSTE